MTHTDTIPTPRVDAKTFTIEKRGPNNVWTIALVHATDAREFEREADALRAELMNIASAKRFDRGRFADDTAFADWAQSRARFALVQP